MFHDAQKSGQWRSQGLRRCRAGRLRCVFRRGQRRCTTPWSTTPWTTPRAMAARRRSTGSPCPKVNDLNNWLFDQGTVSGTLVGIVGSGVARKAHAVDKENGEGLLQRVRQHGGDQNSSRSPFLFETPVSELIVDGKAVVGASGQCADGTPLIVLWRIAASFWLLAVIPAIDLLKKYNRCGPGMSPRLFRRLTAPHGRWSRCLPRAAGSRAEEHGASDGVPHC